MFLLFLGFFVYWLILLSEQSLARLSVHDLEVLRANNDTAAARALNLAEHLRSSLAALLLARLLVVLLLCIGVVNWLFSSNTTKTTLSQFALDKNLPGWLVWGALATLLALAVALILWGLQKIDLLKNKSARTIFVVQRLGMFTFFWKTIFTPFIQKEKKSTEPENAAGTLVEPEISNPANREKRELELLKSIVQFGDITVKQVMQPRSKVVAVDFRIGFTELLNTVCETEFSRMPVIDEDLDNVTGILYVKDLVPFLDKTEDFEWQSLIRTNLMLVPESKRCSELLQEFKEQKMHMAVVVDEYGGSAGIVTLEDILEEVIGDIRDEFDEESEIRYRKLDEYNFLFEGMALLNDVCRVAGLPPNAFDNLRGTSDTLAGLALELRGDIPSAGEEIPCGQFLLTVIAADNRRIEQLKLTLPRS